MGQSILDLVVQELNFFGIRAQKAWPGEMIPALKDVAAAVSLHKADLGKRSATVLVTVLCPHAMGAVTCQNAALEACRILQGMDGKPSQGSCVYDGRTDLYTVEVQAEFFGVALPQEWQGLTMPKIILGGRTLHNSVLFTANRDRLAEMTNLEEAPWHFRIEEFFYPGVAEADEPVEPFSLSVLGPFRNEYYTDCTWTFQRREIDAAGIRQIREGIAGARRVSDFTE